MSKSNQFFRGGMLFLIGAALLLSFATVQSQTSLENALKQYSGDAVKGYIQPVGDLFGANMNSGFFHSAEISKWGFHLSVDIVGMAAMVGDDQKVYDAVAPAGFAPGTFKTATVFGEKGAVVSHATVPGLAYKGSDGVFNTKVFPLAAPQITIGNIYGTQAVVRYVAVPKIGDDKVPKISLWGLGVRHSISQYLPGVPVDIAASFFYDSFSAGDLISYKGYTFGAQASKSFSILTLYTGLAVEKSSLGLTYNSTDPTVPVNVDITLDGANKFRFTGGLCLSLGFMKLFADANFGSITCFSGGIGFGN